VRGITIILNGEEIHTGNDLDLVQEVKKIGKPTVQSYTVQVPGRNGLLNLTKGLTGKVAYYNRSLSFQYFGDGPMSRLLEIDELFSRYHGETIQIIDDDYPDHYYEGEATVSTVFNGNYLTITLSVNAQPFRLKVVKTRYSRAINGETTIYIDNESIETIPTITVTAETEVTFNGVTTNLSAGTHIIESFALQAGANIFTVAGTGEITIEYQEGAI
jgi:hypothetical protein